MAEFGTSGYVLSGLLILYGAYVFYRAIRSGFKNRGYTISGPVFILGGLGSLIFKINLIFLIAFVLGMIIFWFWKSPWESDLP